MKADSKYGVLSAFKICRTVFSFHGTGFLFSSADLHYILSCKERFKGNKPFSTDPAIIQNNGLSPGFQIFKRNCRLVILTEF